MRTIASLPLAFLCLIPIASADIIEVDFHESGDRGAAVDTRTGLEWLDLSLTRDTSASQIVSFSREGELFAGFRHAEFSELETFFLHLGLTQDLSTSPIDSTNLAMGYAQSLLNTKGPVTIAAYFDDAGDPTRTGRVKLDIGWGKVRVTRDSGLSFQHSEDTGHWLVRQFQGSVDALDPTYPFGDANRDGLFNQRDLIKVLESGFYGTGKFGASWLTGDLDGDGFSDRRDLIRALQGGAYQAGRMPAHAIPEPPSWVLLAMVTLYGLIRGKSTLRR